METLTTNIKDREMPQRRNFTIIGKKGPLILMVNIVLPLRTHIVNGNPFGAVLALIFTKELAVSIKKISLEQNENCDIFSLIFSKQFFSGNISGHIF